VPLPRATERPPQLCKQRRNWRPLASVVSGSTTQRGLIAGAGLRPSLSSGEQLLGASHEGPRWQDPSQDVSNSLQGRHKVAGALIHQGKGRFSILRTLTSSAQLSEIAVVRKDGNEVSHLRAVLPLQLPEHS